MANLWSFERINWRTFGSYTCKHCKTEWLSWYSMVFCCVYVRLYRSHHSWPWTCWSPASLMPFCVPPTTRSTSTLTPTDPTPPSLPPPPGDSVHRDLSVLGARTLCFVMIYGDQMWELSILGHKIEMEISIYDIPSGKSIDQCMVWGISMSRKASDQCFCCTTVRFSVKSPTFYWNTIDVFLYVMEKA